MNIREAIQRVVAREHLSEAEMIDVMTAIMAGEATESQIAAFITALRMKGETVQEITGAARVMRQFAVPVRLKRSQSVNLDRDDINIDEETIVDTCGTGGDGTRTFNISTAAALVVAGAGVFVAKHGNRAVSSACGSADVLEHLGVRLELTPEQASRCLSETGIVFLFAPVWHTAMKHAIGPRRQIGIRTIFNVLGPLTNPAGANAQVLGVYAESLVEPIAHVLRNLGVRRAFVVHGRDTGDEVSVTGETVVAELAGGAITRSIMTPERCGVRRAESAGELAGGDAARNAAIIRGILDGTDRGARRDAVILNAAFALAAAGRAPDPAAAVPIAERSLDGGRALRTLEALIDCTNG